MFAINVIPLPAQIARSAGVLRHHDDPVSHSDPARARDVDHFAGRLVPEAERFRPVPEAIELRAHRDRPDLDDREILPRLRDILLDDLNAAL